MKPKELIKDTENHSHFTCRGKFTKNNKHEYYIIVTLCKQPVNLSPKH